MPVRESPFRSERAASWSGRAHAGPKGPKLVRPKQGLIQDFVQEGVKPLGPQGTPAKKLKTPRISPLFSGRIQIHAKKERKNVRPGPVLSLE